MKILAKALATLTRDAIWPPHLGRISPEFVAAALAVLVLPIGLFRLRRFLRPAAVRPAREHRTGGGRRVTGGGWKDDRTPVAGRAGRGLLTPPVPGPQDSRSLEHRVRAERLVMPMRGLRSLVLGTAAAAIWPLYLLLMAYVARQAPWPRSVSIAVSSALVGVALVVLVGAVLKWITRPSGWAECYLEVPAPVARQVGRAGRFVVIAAAATILPAYLLDNGLIAPEGRTVHATSLSRFLILAFELVAWGTWVRLLRGRSPLLSWFAIDSSDEPAGAVPAHASDGAEPVTPAVPSGSRVHAGLVWISRRRRVAAALMLVAIAGVIVLDVARL